MDELNMNKLNEEELNAVDGGVGEASSVKVKPITPIWVKVTSTSLNCRYTPDGEIAKVYEKGHRLKVLIYDPRSDGNGTCYAYIAKKYTMRD